MPGRVSRAEYHEACGGHQSRATVIQERAEFIKHCADCYRIENCEQANDDYVRAEELEQRGVNERQKRRLVEINFAVERLAAKYFFGGCKPQPIIFVEIARIKNAKKKAYDEKGEEKADDCFAADECFFIEIEEESHGFRSRSK